MDELSIKSERNGNTDVIIVSGRVDSVTAGTLDEELEKLVRSDNRIVLDMKDVSYLSSAGVRSIVRAAQSAEKSGGALKLARIPKPSYAGSGKCRVDANVPVVSICG